MNNGFWDEDSVSEYDLVADQAQEAEVLAEEYSQTPLVLEADEDELSEVSEAAAFQLDEQESNTVYNARLRLEQARLYEMLINHDLFEGVDADPRAINVVRNELKHYIVKRLEILMGLHTPVEKKTPSSEVFNPVEADFLKQLAFKGTKGVSKQVESIQHLQEPQTGGLKPLGVKPRQSRPKPVVKPQSKPQPRPEPKIEATAPQPQKKRGRPRKNSVPAQPKEKLAKNNSTKPRDLTHEEIKAIAIQDLKETRGKKPFHKMTTKEKIKEINRVNAKYARSENSAKLPQMTYEEQEQKYMTQQMLAKPGSMGELNNTIARIMIKKQEQGE